MINVLTCRSMEGWPERLSSPYLDEQQLKPVEGVNRNVRYQSVQLFRSAIEGFFLSIPFVDVQWPALLHGIHIDSMMTLSIKCKILCKYFKL